VFAWAVPPPNQYSRKPNRFGRGVDGSESGTGEARNLTSLTDLCNIPHKGQPLGVRVPVLQLAHSKNSKKRTHLISLIYFVIIAGLLGDWKVVVPVVQVAHNIQQLVHLPFSY